MTRRWTVRRHERQIWSSEALGYPLWVRSRGRYKGVGQNRSWPCVRQIGGVNQTLFKARKRIRQARAASMGINLDDRNMFENQWLAFRLQARQTLAHFQIPGDLPWASAKRNKRLGNKLPNANLFQPWYILPRTNDAVLPLPKSLGLVVKLFVQPQNL